MEIQLTQGKVATIDDVDADLAGGWYAGKRDGTFYAYHMIRKPDGRRAEEALHQVIARRMGIVGTPDHVDRNGLNNRRNNLRPATAGQQSAHRGRQSNNTSGYKGVCFHKGAAKWMAYISVDRKRIHLGLFSSEIEAAKAYDRAAIRHHGDFAVLNFPNTETGQK